MHRILRWCALPLIAIGLMSASGSIAHASECGNINRPPITVNEIRAGNTSCATAKRVAKLWRKKVVKKQCDFFTCRARKFSCRLTDTTPASAGGISTSNIRCRRGDSVIVWVAAQHLSPD